MDGVIATGLMVGFVVLGVAGAAVGLLYGFGRCQHPSPHYVKGTGSVVPGAESSASLAQYHCYECGKTWQVKQRDPAWAPVRVVQKFATYDAELAERGTARARLVAEERRRLAARLGEPAELPRPDWMRPRHGHHGQGVIDLTSRRPA